MFNVLLKTSLAFERFWTVGVCTVADILPLIISDKSDGSIWILEDEHSLTIYLMMISLAPSVKGYITELARMHALEDTKFGVRVGGDGGFQSTRQFVCVWSCYWIM